MRSAEYTSKPNANPVRVCVDNKKKKDEDTA